MSKIILATQNATNLSVDSSITPSKDKSLVQRVKTSSHTMPVNNLKREKRVVSTVLTLSKTAETLAINGQYIKAFHYFRQAMEAGSPKARYFLTGQKKSTVQNKPIDISPRFILSQIPILEKIKLFLTGLQKTNPAYNEETVQKILSDLSRGHCKGLSIYYGQLSLEVENNQDSTGEYRDIARKIVEWDGIHFEPPQGFNYRQYHAGDKQGLTPEDEKRMLLTDDIKQFFQMFRYAQQRFHEASEWVSEPVLEKMNRGNIPLHSQTNIQGILGTNYKVKQNIHISAARTFLFNHLAGSLCSNLKESNVAILKFPTSIGVRGAHVVTILFRENRYYLMDSNNTSNEVDFDDRYHAIAFETPEQLLTNIALRYLGEMTTEIFELSFFEKRDRKNNYISSDPKFHQNLMRVNQLYERLGEDLFNRAFPAHADTFKLKADIVREISDKGALTLLTNPQIVEIDLSALDISIDDEKTFRSLIRACPRVKLVTNPSQREILGNVYCSLGNDYEKGQYADLIIKNIAEAIFYYKEAASIGNCEAKYRLAKLYKSDDPQHQNHPEYIRLLFEIAAVKNDPRVSFELGSAYMRGRYGLEIDFYKARDYFSCEQSPPIARVLYARVNITILVREEKVKELIRTAMALRSCDEPSDTHKRLALKYLKAAESLGSKTASKLIAYMYANKEVPVENPESFLEALMTIADTTDGKSLLAKSYRSGNILPRDLHKALDWYNAIDSEDLKFFQKERFSLLQEIKEMEKAKA